MLINYAFIKNGIYLTTNNPGYPGDVTKGRFNPILPRGGGESAPPQVFLPPS